MSYFVSQLEQVVQDQQSKSPESDSASAKKSVEKHNAFWNKKSKSYLPSKSVSKRHSVNFGSRIGSLTSNQDILDQIDKNDEDNDVNQITNQ